MKGTFYFECFYFSVKVRISRFKGRIIKRTFKGANECHLHLKHGLIEIKH